MKKFLIVLLAVGAVGLFYFFRPAEIANYLSSGTDVIALGDSLTAGTGSAAGGGFVTMISDDLGLPVVNLGRNGDTTGKALGRISELDRYRPKVVILLLGGNDYLAGVPREVILSNLRQIIDEIHKRGATVLLLGLDGSYEELAEEKKTAYVSGILDGIFGRKELMSDGLHPNDRGYKLMAEKIEPALKELMR